MNCFILIQKFKSVLFVVCFCHSLLLVSIHFRLLAGEFSELCTFKPNFHVMFISVFSSPCSITYFNSLYGLLYAVAGEFNELCTINSNLTVYHCSFVICPCHPLVLISLYFRLLGGKFGELFA